MSRGDETDPITGPAELPAPEIGDRSSDDDEPEGGWPDAPEPETEPEGADPLGGAA